MKPVTNVLLIFALLACVASAQYFGYGGLYGGGLGVPLGVGVGVAWPFRTGTIRATTGFGPWGPYGSSYTASAPVIPGVAGVATGLPTAGAVPIGAGVGGVEGYGGAASFPYGGLPEGFGMGGAVPDIRNTQDTRNVGNVGNAQELPSNREEMDQRSRQEIPRTEQRLNP